MQLTQKKYKIMKFALENRIPIIGINDSVGQGFKKVLNLSQVTLTFFILM